MQRQTDTEMRLLGILEPLVIAHGAEVVELTLRGPMGNQLLRLFIDHPDGVTLGLCAAVSRDISAVLDVEDPITGRYVLEVSSPGVERPLTKRSDFARFAGKEVQVRFAGERRKERVTGVLLGIDETDQVLVARGEVGPDGPADVVRIPLGDIDQAKLVFRFGADAPPSAPRRAENH